MREPLASNFPIALSIYTPFPHKKLLVRFNLIPTRTPPKNPSALNPQSFASSIRNFLRPYVIRKVLRPQRIRTNSRAQTLTRFPSPRRRLQHAANGEPAAATPDISILETPPGNPTKA